ncbi:hypothetical protein [Planktotalea arctica]|uniref:hypothetical protein n=1 Tax=Planktotalea arctica TaxID=1481893 RepID=UPI000A173E2A|nr:hypothetical protein [Planktotalea arctica]
MIDLIKQFEDVPAVYPDAPDGLSTAAAAMDANLIWARIEAYTAHRFTAREVVWTLLGDAGDQFHPRLAPVVSSFAHHWGDEWDAVTLQSGPLGFVLPFDGTYRITAQVGAGLVPAPVSEAFRRLVEYMSEEDGPSGSSSFVSSIGPLEESVTRSPNWMARAMQQSGAGDLLRSYRRA